MPTQCQFSHEDCASQSPLPCVCPCRWPWRAQGICWAAGLSGDRLGRATDSALSLGPPVPLECVSMKRGFSFCRTPTAPGTRPPTGHGSSSPGPRSCCGFSPFLPLDLMAIFPPLCLACVPYAPALDAGTVALGAASPTPSL